MQDTNSLFTHKRCCHQNIFTTTGKREASWAIQTAITLVTYQWNQLQQPLMLCCCNIRNPHMCFMDGFLCLSCVYLLCREEEHLLEHHQLSNHYLFFDISFMRIYCFHCRDYVADQLSSSILSSIFRLDWETGDKTSQVLKGALLPPRVKRKLQWIPSQQEIEWMKEYSVSLDNEESILCPYPGLCGLLNLGNSCYMNAILQVMLHTLPLKRYFLSDYHRSNCSRNIQECAACALDDLWMKGLDESFAKDISEREALSPQFIMEIIWKHCDSLASYAQHDAHEFFITFVNVLRQHIIGEHNNNLSERREDGVNGKQMIDHLFSGVIESHVYCGNCKHYSATLEDYFDISLDLNASQESNASIRTLQDCLTYFTSPEELDNGITRYCNYCQQNTAFYKRVAIQRLPQVLCFHLKRFQHGLDGKGVSSKVESEIAFPIHSLDMSPYISSQILESPLPSSRKLKDRNDRKAETMQDELGVSLMNEEYSQQNFWNPDSSNQQVKCERYVQRECLYYDLYAVVNHIGKIDHGHYITWIREQRNSSCWFKCDDECITLEPFSTSNNAQSSQAYLLFYISRNSGELIKET